MNEEQSNYYAIDNLNYFNVPPFNCFILFEEYTQKNLSHKYKRERERERIRERGIETEREISFAEKSRPI